jgi:hypothetical protein
MNKKKLLLISIVASIALVAGALIMTFREKPTIIMELAIYGGSSRTTYYTLDENGVLRSYLGERYGYKFTSERPGKYMRKVQSSTRTKLSEEEMSNLIHLLDDLGEGRISNTSGGIWLELLYNDDVYFMWPLFNTGGSFVRLLWELRKLTGVPEEFWWIMS